MKIALAAVHYTAVAIPIRGSILRDWKPRRCNADDNVDLVVVVMYCCCCLQSAIDFVVVARETAMPFDTTYTVLVALAISALAIPYNGDQYDTVLAALEISYDGNRVGLMLLAPMLL